MRHHSERSEPPERSCPVAWGLSCRERYVRASANRAMKGLLIELVARKQAIFRKNSVDGTIPRVVFERFDDLALVADPYRFGAMRLRKQPVVIARSITDSVMGVIE